MVPLVWIGLTGADHVSHLGEAQESLDSLLTELLDDMARVFLYIALDD